MYQARKSKTDEGGSDHLLSVPTNSSPELIPLTHGWRVIKQIISANQVYKLLIFFPLGIIAGVLDWNPIAVFALNLLAIVPLAVLLSAVTEELSGSVRQSVGALLNATFGNAVELIVSLSGWLRSTDRFHRANAVSPGLI